MKHKPYHIYSMQQAIEEGFIKDVLLNFTPIATAYEIAKNIVPFWADDNGKLEGYTSLAKIKASSSE